MTTPIAYQVGERRARARAQAQRRSIAATWRAGLLAMLAEATAIRFPSPHYRADPVAFVREILGIGPWSKQIEILEMVRDHRRVAVTSGHKTGKSSSAAMLALWFYCSFPDARVVMSSTTARQVDQILWRELKMMRARGGVCTACKAADPDGRRTQRPCPHSSLIEGEIGELARTGLKSVDFREIVGFTAREAEAVAGISGRNLMYILDEASGIPSIIYEAIEGNRAGGARLVLFSNPTRTEGEFFDAFHGKSQFYKTIRISSEETPNAISGEQEIPGLAGREWIEEKKQEWGEDSPLYKVRVRGEFATREDGKIFSIHAINAAEQRWKDGACDQCEGGVREGRTCSSCDGSGRKPAAGRLFIGLDPAGPTGSGDESVFAPRRGAFNLGLLPHRGLNADGLLVQALSLVDRLKLKTGRETPVVVIDSEGSIGAELFGKMRAFLDGRLGREPFELVAVKASAQASRRPDVYDRQRDALIGNLEEWFRAGGGIVEDAKLAAELHVLEWKQQINGKLKVTPKDEIKKKLGRSPDRLDALALSCWEPLSLIDDLPDSARKAEAAASGPAAPDPYAYDALVDPYANW